MLLNKETLVGQKPTIILKKMQKLLQDESLNMGSEILRELLLQRLPEHVKYVLTAFSPETPLQQLAESADRMLGSDNHNNSTVYNLSTNSNPPSDHVTKSDIQNILDKITAMNARIDKLSSDVAVISSRFDSPSAHMSRPRSPAPSYQRRPRSPSRNLQPKIGLNLCYYH